MSAAMKMEYTPIPLATVFDVDAIVNISYYKLENGYVFSGESHFFWEFIYVDRGSIVVTAGADKYFLKAGELAKPCTGWKKRFCCCTSARSSASSR